MRTDFESKLAPPARLTYMETSILASPRCRSRRLWLARTDAEDVHLAPSRPALCIYHSLFILQVGHAVLALALCSGATVLWARPSPVDPSAILDGWVADKRTGQPLPPRAREWDGQVSPAQLLT